MRAAGNENSFQLSKKSTQPATQLKKSSFMLAAALKASPPVSADSSYESGFDIPASSDEFSVIPSPQFPQRLLAGSLTSTGRTALPFPDSLLPVRDASSLDSRLYSVVPVMQADSFTSMTATPVALRDSVLPFGSSSFSALSAAVNLSMPAAANASSVVGAQPSACTGQMLTSTTRLPYQFYEGQAASISQPLGQMHQGQSSTAPQLNQTSHSQDLNTQPPGQIGQGQAIDSQVLENQCSVQHQIPLSRREKLMLVLQEHQ